MLRDSAVEDGASRHEKQNDTCEVSKSSKVVNRFGFGLIGLAS